MQSRHTVQLDAHESSFVNPGKTTLYRLQKLAVLGLAALGLNLMSIYAYAATESTPASTLKASHQALENKLVNNQFKRALYLNSIESGHDLTGEIYAVIDYPFKTVNTELNNPDHWCDMLILHINIKYCRASMGNDGDLMTVYLGNKNHQPLADAYRIGFVYTGATTSTDYFSVALNAKNGPLGTSNYHIWVEAIPIDHEHTFLHFTFSYTFGLTSRIAMQAYLATLGLGKVGFTVKEKLADGDIRYITGSRGVIERNTMRYYLAIDAYLSALATAKDQQLDRRLHQWYNATEQYALQLHEVELPDYIEMKHQEYIRQQTAE